MSLKRLNKSSTPNNSPNREELYQMAVNAARNGQNNGAKVMFAQVLQQNKRDIRAMMWMAKLANNKKERTAWLQRVLDVKPDYTPAQEALDKMAYDDGATRNQTLLRYGVIAYVAVTLVWALLSIFGALSASV